MGKPLVSICCLVYNHSSYLRECLDGFVKQRTNFPVEILIHDDASTDNSREIIQAFIEKSPDLFVPIFQSENQFSKGGGVMAKFVFPLAQGKYIALCEGDDYWTDPMKLQKQVDFLESHNEYGFVGSFVNSLYPDNNFSLEECTLPRGIQEGEWILYKDVMDFAKYGPVCRTVTLCFRKDIILPYLNDICGDLILETVLAKYSSFAMLATPTAVYRRDVGISAKTNDLQKQLRYNEWLIKNRMVQKRLFPQECNWNEDELLDRKDYIHLKFFVKERKWREAMKSKRQLRSSSYQKKSFSKYLVGPISCFLLSFFSK